MVCAIGQPTHLINRTRHQQRFQHALLRLDAWRDRDGWK